MHVIQGFLTLVARIAIAAIFLVSAVVGKIMDFNTVVEQMTDKGVPQPKLMLAGAIAFLILGSLSLVLGFWARGGAFLLLVFLAAATYYFHAFWQLPADTPPETRVTEQIQFMKNLALMGGMLFIVANGGGPWSMDARRRAGGQGVEAGEEA